MTSPKKRAPDFELPDSSGRMHTLGEFNGKKLVLYFYPKDLTPGCTLEGRDFSKLLADFHKNKAEVVGISADSQGSHKRFCDKLRLKVILLSDVDKKVCKAYGVWKEKSFMGKKYMGIERATFLIEDGKIAHAWRDVKALGHAKDVLNAVRQKGNE